MKIGLSTREDDKIVTIKDYSNIREKGQVAHFLCEIKLIEVDLLEIWEKWNVSEDSLNDT